MSFVRILFVFLLALYLSGCSSNAKVENMAYQGAEKVYVEELKDNIEVTSVAGGKESNSLWTSQISSEAFSIALEKSLIDQNLFSKNGDYELSVNFIKIDQPVFGMDFEVKTYIQYKLKNTITNHTVFNETVFAPYTAVFGDALVATDRLRLANEGSANKNIEMFLEELSDLKIRPNQISLRN